MTCRRWIPNLQQLRQLHVLSCLHPSLARRPPTAVTTPTFPARLLSDADQAPGATMLITASKNSGERPSLGASIAMNRLRFPVMMQVTIIRYMLETRTRTGAFCFNIFVEYENAVFDVGRAKAHPTASKATINIQRGAVRKIPPPPPPPKAPPRHGCSSEASQIDIPIHLPAFDSSSCSLEIPSEERAGLATLRSKELMLSRYARRPAARATAFSNRHDVTIYHKSLGDVGVHPRLDFHQNGVNTQSLLGSTM